MSGAVIDSGPRSRRRRNSTPRLRPAMPLRPPPFGFVREWRHKVSPSAGRPRSGSFGLAPLGFIGLSSGGAACVIRRHEQCTGTKHPHRAPVVDHGNILRSGGNQPRLTYPILGIPASRFAPPATATRKQKPNRRHLAPVPADRPARVDRQRFVNHSPATVSLMVHATVGIRARGRARRSARGKPAVVFSGIWDWLSTWPGSTVGCRSNLLGR
jgi:hypothetical protein